MSKRLYLVDVNEYQTWVDNPEKVMGTTEIGFAWQFIWPVDSHPGMWVNGAHVVRWWLEEQEDDLRCVRPDCRKASE